MLKKQNMTAKTYNKILYLAIGLIILVTVFLGVFFVIVLNKFSKETSEKKYILLANSKKIEALSNLQGNYREMSEERDRIEKYLPSDKGVSTLITDLENIANTNGLVFKEYKIPTNMKTTSSSTDEDVQTKKIDDYSAIPFEISISGSFSKVEDMIKNMESYGRLIEIRTVSYKKLKDQGPAKDNVDATLTITAYLKK